MEPAIAPSVPATKRAGRAAVDPPLDHAERLVEHPAEDPAADVAEQAAEHPAEALRLGTKGARGPKARGRAQDHDEEPNPFDEHPGLIGGRTAPS